MAVALAAAGDARIEHWALRHRGPTLDRLGDAGDALGSGRVLAPALAAGWIGARLTRRPGLERAATHAVVAYVAGNVVVSVLKPAVGRHRPDTTGSAWRFSPFASGGEWHSFPSAHTLHAVTIAAALAEDGHRPWLAAGAAGVGALVAWSRVYRDEHWTSDVVSSSVIGIATSRLTSRLARRLDARMGGHPSSVVAPVVGAGMAGARIAFGHGPT